MKNTIVSTIGLRVFVAGIYLFLYIPIFILIIFSFNNGPFPAPWVGFTLNAYYELFRSPLMWKAFMNSAIVALSATSLCLLFSLSLIYYECHEKSFGGLIQFFFGSTVVPEVVLAMGLLSFFSFFTIPLGLIALIIGHTVLGMGYAIPLIYARYKAIDARLQEASFDLGASKSQAFFTVTVPLLRPTLLVTGLLVFIISFDDFLISYFCAGGEAQTLSLYIYSMIRLGISPMVNALSTVLLVFSSLLVILFSTLSFRKNLW